MSDHPTRTVPPRDQPTADPPGYELLDEIGRGGMGVVYRARDLALDRDVAVKILSQDRFGGGSVVARRFVDEARITGQLQHPGIPAVHQVGALPDGRPFLAMKLIKGQTLDELLKERADPTAGRGRLLAVFEQVCQGVGYAHAHKIIHRDLKPVNIMVGAFGEVQVMDWGLAKLLTSRGVRPPGSDDDPDTTLGTEIRSTRGLDLETQAGSLLGTPAFMPPEQAIGAIDQIDARSDVFGLGAILCVILTGKPPYVGADAESTRQLAARAQLDDAFERLDGCGAEPDLVALCRRCLAGEKANRPKDAGEVAKAVAKLRTEADERARQAELDRVRAEGEQAKAEAETREQRKRRRVQLALTGAVLLLLGGGGAFAWWQEKATTRQREQLSRNADAVAELLTHCEDALRDDDAEKAGLAFEQAEKRVAEGGADHLTDRFARCRADLDLLRELDAIDTFRWTPVEGKFLDAKAVEARWRTAFAGYGAAPGETPAGEAAGRVGESLIRDRLLATLDLWLVEKPSPWVREVLRAADPDVYRDAVRDAITAKDNARAAELAERPKALTQPPRFAAALGHYRVVSPERRRSMLEAALRGRPGDLALLNTLGFSYPLNQREGADEQVRWFQAAVAAHPRCVEGHNGLGIALASKGDSDGAAACYREVIRLDPKYVRGYLNLGIHLFYNGDLDGAIPALKEAIRLDPKSGSAHYNLGRTLAAKGDPERAIAEYEEVIRLDPTDVPAYVGLGLVSKNRGNLDGAIAKFKEAIRLNPNSALAHLNLGLALKTKGDLDGAIAEFKLAIRGDPKNVDAHHELGLALRDKGDRDGEMAAYRDAIRLNPAEPHARYQLGMVLLERGMLDESIANFREAVRLNPKRAYFHADLGRALREKGNVDEAIAACREAIRLDPKFAWAHNHLGDALAKKGDRDGAIAAYKEAVRLDPKNATVINNLTAALKDNGGSDAAIAEYREAIRIKPDDASAHATLGQALRNKKDLDGAIAAFKEAARLDPKNALFRVTLGNALKDQKDFDGAIAAYKAATRLNPNDNSIPPQMRDCYVAKGDPDGAVKAAREAVQLYPTASFIRHGLGDALQFLKKDPVAAAVVYREAIRLNPIYAWSHNNLGTALWNTDLDGAIVEFRESVRLDPGFTAAHNNLGNALREKKDLDGAVAAYKEAIRLDPKFTAAHISLGQARWDKKDLDGAIVEFREAIRLDPKEPHIRSCLGDALRDKGDLDGAIASYREGIRLDPNRGYIHVGLGTVLKDKGELAEAIAELKEAVRLGPKNGHAHYLLARLLATGPDGVRDGKQAVELATRACELSEWKFAGWIDTLAAAYAEIGDFDKAIEFQNKALAVSFPAWEKGEGKDARQRLDLYGRKKPYRDPALAAEKPGKLAPSSPESK